MRPVLPFALLLGFPALFAGPSCASECADDPCSDGSCRRDWWSGDEELCRCVPPPERPGSYCCVAKPEVKDLKKTVYEVKWAPYCLPKASCPHCGADCRRPCPECEKCVRWKKVLVKREVVVGRKACYTCAAEECSPKARRSSAGLPAAPTSAPPAPPAWMP